MAPRSWLPLLAVAALALGGCGSSSNDEPLGAPPSTVPASPLAAVPPSQPITVPSATPGRTGASTAAVTVTGQVVDGVESGCVLLRTDDGPTYLLIGGDKTVLVAGKRVTVVGSPQPGMMSMCQQGTPFAVSSVRPA